MTDLRFDNDDNDGLDGEFSDAARARLAAAEGEAAGPLTSEAIEEIDTALFNRMIDAAAGNATDPPDGMTRKAWSSWLAERGIGEEGAPHA
jgi:hypothetical protein